MPIIDDCDSFRHETTSANRFGGDGTTGIWNAQNAAASFPTTGGPHGGGYLLLVQSGAAENYLERKIPTAAQRVISYYFRVPSAPSVDSWLGYLTKDDGTKVALFTVLSTGVLRAQVNPASGTVDGPNVADNLWHRLDFYSDVSGTTYTLDWQIDGSVQTQATRAGQVASTTTKLLFGTQTVTHTLTAHYAEYVASATAGDYPIGRHKVLPLIADADGTHNAGVNVIEDQAGADIGAVTAFDLLDEWAANTASYVQQVALGAGNYAELTFPNVPENDIWFVQGYAALFSSNLNANNGTTRIVDSGGTTLTDIYAGDMSETVLHYRRAPIAVPGGGSWDQSKLNGIKARVGFSSDVDGVPRWASLLLDYAVSDLVSLVFRRHPARGLYLAR